ncbi:PadR family transcriptional regulator [Flexivirga endophytica]|uniref:PadR family transcriptional regulator n=1 Tax=Flexivirga endophytica TaxID=1849103 RepID=A0A916SZ75_9MICO|nr:PadR family transcriptional regulator [Flexivirga endophytica]GGB23095.1 PadR family transcriptional regulator [Flexivirga endophytica]GHB56999.1 PadR family transcriptional regulator [Flexivirga endophytica]
MSRRGAILELAILGLLHDQPLHGYELRKQLSGVLGAFRAVSFGSLYPCLRGLVERGWISERASGNQDRQVPGLGGKRGKITYELTAEGKEQFQTLMAQTGPASWEDENFDVHFAFFGRASSDVRLRILEGRRSRLEERLDDSREQSRQRRERTDKYTAELHRHGLESTEREVRWLSELIETERSAYRTTNPGTAASAGQPVDGETPEHASDPTEESDKE